MALKKAFAQKPADAIVIHHSDRGIQYCSIEYTNLLLQKQLHYKYDTNMATPMKMPLPKE